MNGWTTLRVSVACEACGLILHSEIVDIYQTKGGRWEKSLSIKKGAIESHLHCEVKEVKR